MRSRSISFLLFALCLVLNGCSADEAKETAEASAIPRFHAQYDRSDFAAIYREATDEFRSATTRAEYDKFMAAVRRKLGRVRSTTRTNWNVNVGTGGTRIILTYDTEFELGKGTETFTFLKGKQGPKLLGYHVNSNVLVTN